MLFGDRTPGYFYVPFVGGNYSEFLGGDTGYAHVFKKNIFGQWVVCVDPFEKVDHCIDDTVRFARVYVNTSTPPVGAFSKPFTLSPLLSNARTRPCSRSLSRSLSSLRRYDNGWLWVL